ncbi:pneumococcal serine-rich repeat protein-like isoform X2 [Tympanuchus pallidicinctus]|uniref:pneumococcal serine-rich repeat protein-like isoform X2 n=1 Tax=Tympanuchus pallidicinctus TaxID=109042 RepID=UPI002287164B|nr:pneumococcal serine-rich repeat protein-like isoform X2 [Tympanuchus pallidicinctus]
MSKTTATNHASVAATKASVATKQTLVAAANTSVVVTNQALVATKQSSLATTSASVATSNQALVATKQRTVATTSASMAASNQGLVATKQTLMSATSSSMAASNHTSVTTTSVAISQTSVAANASVNLTEQTLLSCQSFQCFGERCYQDEAHRNTTATCHNETLCELYRFSSTNYTARCSSVCRAELCRTNGSMALQQCTVECCNTSLCLQLNASSYGDLPPTTVPPTTTITTTTTLRPPPRNGKICAAFSCHGDGCFKGKKSTTRCFVGHDFCEMKKTGFNYVAGCSKACKAAKPVCAQGVKAACFQECCPATLKGSCLKLDGKVHVNGAGQVAVSPLLQLLVWGAALLLSCKVSTPLHG